MALKCQGECRCSLSTFCYKLQTSGFPPKGTYLELLPRETFRRHQQPLRCLSAPRLNHIWESFTMWPSIFFFYCVYMQLMTTANDAWVEPQSPIWSPHQPWLWHLFNPSNSVRTSITSMAAMNWEVSLLVRMWWAPEQRKKHLFGECLNLNASHKGQGLKR